METYFEAVVTSVSQLAEQYYRLGQLETALDVMSSGIQLCDHKDVSSATLTRSLLSQAKLQAIAIFMGDGSPDDALKTLERCQTLTDDALLLARTDDLRGLVHYYAQLNQQDADYQVAEQALARVASYEAILHDEWHSEWLFHRGLIYQNTDRIDMAREAYQQSYDIARLANLVEIQSFAIRHLGFIQQYTDKDLTTARNSFEESLQLRESIGLKIYLPFSYQTLGAVCVAQDDTTSARNYFEQARTSALDLGNQRALTLILLGIGDLNLRESKHDDARQCYQQAKTTASDINFERAIVYADTQLAELES